MNRHQAHYHIRWSGKTALDWERFSSRADAEAGAKQLMRMGETYTIEEHDGACQRCRNAMKYARGIVQRDVFGVGNEKRGGE